MMMRGVRGATTVTANEESEMMKETKQLVKEMVNRNNVVAEAVSHVLISVTKDLNAGFPAKVLRQMPGWDYVPVMCMTEIDVPLSLAKCIRVMMVIHSTNEQHEIQHIFQNEAVQLRPDLVKKKGE